MSGWPLCSASPVTIPDKPITDPTDVGKALDEALKIVESGKPVVVDIHTTAR